MRKLLFLFVAISLVLFSCKKDKVEKDGGENGEVVTNPFDNLNPQARSWALCLNYTANWCGPCGSSGHEMMANAVNVGRTVGVALKVSGDPQAIPNELLESFESDRPTGGHVPSFSVGDQVDVGDPAVKCNQQIQRPCYMGVDASQKISNGTLSVYVKTKNFEPLPNISDYYIVAYLLEDDLHYPQEGSSSSDPVHNFVLRKTSSGNVYYGQQLMTDGAMNAEYTHTFTFDVSAYNANKCYAAVVVYRKKTGSIQYSYVNCCWTRK